MITLSVGVRGLAIGALFVGTFRLWRTSYPIAMLPLNRVDSVLSTIIDTVRPKLIAGKQLFSDMPGHQAPHGGTIPPHILVTNLRPDIFIIDELKREAVVFELTCPWDTNVDRSHSYKEDKYAP